MKHKTWFRLVIKAIGVLVIGLAVPELIQSGLAVIWWMIEGSGSFGAPSGTWWYLVQPISAFAQGGFGLYLFFRGEWIVNKAIPSNKPYCPECGYDISAMKGLSCPQCGVMLERVTSQDAQQSARESPS